MKSENIKAGELFPDEETFQRISSECMENWPQAPESLQKAYRDMWTAFENYKTECDDYVFRHAYQCGYEAGKAARK